MSTDDVFSGRGDDPLAKFVRDMREAFASPPAAATQARHLRAMAEEFAAAPAPAPARRPRRRLPVGRAAIAALAATVVAAGTALAATGNLPGPAQDAVAHAAKTVGLTIPSHASTTGRTHGDAGKARAGENKARAKTFTDAKQTWTQCVAQAAQQHAGSGAFDPQAACGPKPTPQEPAATGAPAAVPGSSPGEGSGAGNANGNGNGNGPPATAGSSGNSPGSSSQDHGQSGSDSGSSHGQSSQSHGHDGR